MRIESSYAPVAIQTDKALFLGVEVRMPPIQGGCYVSKPFAGKAIDVAGCGADRSCILRSLNGLLSSLRKTFSAAPILAEQIHGSVAAPGEIEMARERKPSKILGAPYYELSTYFFETWIAEDEDPYGSLYGRHHFKGENGVQRVGEYTEKASLVFLRVDHIFTRSVHRNGVYSEPEPNEIARMESAVKSATTSAIAHACKGIHGVFEEPVCKVRSPLTGGAAQ